MKTRPTNRIARPDAEAIRRLRLEKGWRVEDLAKEAICSVKTVQNVERGANVYFSTLAKLAKPLGVKFTTLVRGHKPPPEPPTPQSCVRIQFVVSLPFAQFDESKQLHGFIEFLKKFMQSGGDINVLGVEPGSTIITVEVSVEDMLALSSAYSAGKLAKMHVVELRLKHNPKPVHPGFKTYDPTLDTKSSLTGGKSKDVPPSKIEPQRRTSKKRKPETER